MQRMSEQRGAGQQVVTGAARIGTAWSGARASGGELSAGARKALVDAGTSRQGAVIAANELVTTELAAAGLIGQGRGLTRSGGIARDRIMAAMLDELF